MPDPLRRRRGQYAESVREFARFGSWPQVRQRVRSARLGPDPIRLFSAGPGATSPARGARVAAGSGYVLAAGVLVVMMLGGTLPVPLYVLYEKQIGFGPLVVTVVFVAYVLGTLLVLVALGDLSDHLGRRKVLALAVLCAMISSALFLAAAGIGLLIVARIVSGMAAGFATGTATAALAEQSTPASTSPPWWRSPSCWPSSSYCALSRFLRPGRRARHQTAGAAPGSQRRPAPRAVNRRPAQ